MQKNKNKKYLDKKDISKKKLINFQIIQFKKPKTQKVIQSLNIYFRL